MFYFPLASTQVWGAGLSGCPLVRTGIARVRRARLGEVMMIKQPGSRGLLRKTRGEEAGGVAIPLGQMWLATEDGSSASRMSSSRRLNLVCKGQRQENRPLERQKTRSIGGRVCWKGGDGGETKGQGSGYLNQDCSMGMRTRYDLKWIAGKWTIGPWVMSWWTGWQTR